MTELINSHADVNVPVTIMLGPEHRQAGKVLCFSSDGLVLYLAHAYAVGTEIAVDFATTHSGARTAFRFKAKVSFILVLANNTGVNLTMSFTHIDPAHKAIIRDLYL